MTRTSSKLCLALLLCLFCASPAWPQSDADKQRCNALNKQVVELYQAGKYAEAAQIGEELVKLAEKAFGPQAPGYAKYLNNLALLYNSMGDYAHAEPLYKQASQILRKALGEKDPYYATSLNNLGALYWAMGDYARAEPLLKQALEISRKALGENHPDYAISLNCLALLYHSMGDYARAEPLLKQSLEIRRKALGENHPDYATSLNNLAELYRAMGDYGRAEPLLKQAIEIRRRALGENHPSYASSLNNLALLYSVMGDYARAEPLMKQAMEIRRKALGEDHPDYATSVASLGVLYQDMGDYARAEPLYKQAMEIRRKALGENHPDYATSLNNLAGLYRAMGDYARAEPLYKQALDIRRRALGENHPDYATSLNNLALLYEDIGDYTRAEPLLKQAMEIRRKTLGENHPDYATGLNNLAGVYLAMGNYARAEPLHKQTMEIFRKALGESHPSYATSLNNLAVLYAAWDKPVQGLQCFNDGMKSLHAHSLNVLVGLSPDRKLEFLRHVWCNLEAYLTFVVHYHNVPGPLAVLQRSNELEGGGAVSLARWKALSAEVQTEQYRLLRLAGDAETRNLLADLDSARRDLARWTLSPPAKMGFEQVRLKREEMEQKLAALEDTLAKKSIEFAELRRIGSADLTQIAQALPSDSALLDFARFRQFNFKAKGKEPKWGDYRYIASITHPSSLIPHQSVLVDLGPAKPIDDAVKEFRSAIERPDALPVDQTLKSISKLVIDPMLPHVKDRKHLIICPDGQLALVPFECLLTDNGKYLVESYQISYLGAGREAVAYAGTGTPKSEGDATPDGVKSRVPFAVAAPLLFGDPDFDLSLDTQVAVAGGETAALRGLRASRDLARVRFDRLPGTRTEAEIAAKMLNGKILLDRQATEGAVKKASRPDILYLATHGFFLPDQEIPREEKGGPRGVLIGEERPPGPKTRIENPLLRCGLALAGANHRDSVPPESGADDGILTGMEVAGLDLWGTRLVVLSACETGIGDIKQGEGVMGLRRAFLLAGARRVLSTLWKVPDQQTQELMTDFVKRWQSGTPAVKALREAQLAMIERLRKEKSQAHPFFWSAFTMTGDWR